MLKKYKVLIHFKGSASLEVEADTVEAARRKISEIEMADITRVGHADVLAFEVAAREITETVGPGNTGDENDNDAANRPRPSGWFRPAT